MIEKEPQHDFYYLFFLPSTVDISINNVTVSIHLERPEKIYKAKPYFNIILKKGRMEIYPKKVNRKKEYMMFIFHIEDQGTYELLERSVLTALNVPELLILAKKYEIKSRWELKKDQLIVELEPLVGGLTLEELKRDIKIFEAT